MSDNFREHLAERCKYRNVTLDTGIVYNKLRQDLVEAIFEYIYRVERLEAWRRLDAPSCVFESEMAEFNKAKSEISKLVRTRGNRDSLSHVVRGFKFLKGKKRMDAIPEEAQEELLEMLDTVFK